MQLSLNLIFVATIVASEALALATSGNAAASGVELSANIKRHHKKRTCKAKSSKKTSSRIATSSSGSSSGSVSSSITGHKKLGLSWTYGNYMDINLFDNKAGWRYNWKESDNTKSNLPYFPMLWNDDGSRVAAWQKNVVNNPSSVTSKTIMAPNEPDVSSQANMSPEAVCSLMRKQMLPLKKNHGFKIIGPAVVNLEGDWYPRFVKACPDVQKEIDADAVHLYDSLASTSISRLQKWHSTYKRPIYITEVACHSFYITSKAPQCTGSGMANSFYSGLTKFVANSDYMAGIAPFGVFKANLPDGVGNFNRLSTTSGTPTNLWNMITSLI
ncbi:glycoside hydrolase family 128 protein [Tilletiaria anomala UBC 951]|uniref:Glycoside hydrolase family 128 protein n=1 Tax=Tilletiaria anomala (strain ATCC 24038 / CBS 436.72 / UBC 951) TaxID=1037660 RepID=A0A066VQN2_TILAU|nr:glycoside hydrolase family 128 protein [Tilletiaria anomala UBC 951]KDN43771.1 glycoside hydrolase family 128 protein [Tilletiaria anomala UBC 951]